MGSNHLSIFWPSHIWSIMFNYRSIFKDDGKLEYDQKRKSGWGRTWKPMSYLRNRQWIGGIDHIIAVFKYLSRLNVNEIEFCIFQKQYECGAFLWMWKDIKNRAFLISLFKLRSQKTWNKPLSDNYFHIPKWGICQAEIDLQRKWPNTVWST